MTMLRLILAALLLATATAHAQSPANAEEIAFWETVRDSKNAAELQAYIDQYPNGRFVVLAKARLAALPKPAGPTTIAPPPPRVAPAPIASYAPGKVTSETRMPQADDAWTYQLSYPRLRGQWGQSNRPPATHVVKVLRVADGRIVDQLSVDGGSFSETTHSSGAYLLPQGVSIFSPYLIDFRDLPQRGSAGSVTILDPACSGRYACEASARTVGQESVQVPAGTFNAIKVEVIHTWRSSGSTSGGSAYSNLMGGRSLTVWYVPELKRAVKMQSRITVGETPPVESNFDLELIGYQVR